MNRVMLRHSRARLRLALSIPLLCLHVVLPSGCSNDTPAQVRDPSQRRERVEIAVIAARESAAEDMHNSRQSVTRINAGLNDAVTAPFPGHIEVDLPASGSETFAGALALTGFPKGRSIPQLRLYFEIDFVGASGVRKHGPTIGLAEALAGWTPVEFVRGIDEPVKLTIRGSFITADAPKDLPDLRMCLALPDDSVLKKPDPALPNVLVISIDTLRADHLGCYGYSRATSPHLDALVQRGVLFERAYSSAPWTLPSYGSLFTGLLPADHRAGIVTEREDAWGRDVEPAKGTAELLRRDVPTLAEIMSQRGYRTAGFVSNPFLGSAAGVARGFQSYTSYQYNAQTGVDLALEWIGARSSARWFVFLHVIDPHLPYAPPRPFDTQFSKQSIDELKDWPPGLDQLRTGNPDAALKQMCVDQYDGEVAFVDAQIGRLLETLKSAGQLDDTLVVLHSDHGEEFWEHGSCDHGHTQYDELLHVPFALVWPKKLPAKRVHTRVRTLDLLPTIAELIGVAAPKDIEGKSLLTVIDGRESADRDTISEAIMHGKIETKALIQGKEKLIASGSAFDVLFDLEADPIEQADHTAKAPDVVKAMRERLRQHHEKAKASAKSSAPLQLDAGAAHRLATNGYVGVDTEGSKPPKKP